MAPEATALKDEPMSGMMAGLQPSPNVLTDDETITLPGGRTERSDMTAPSDNASEFTNEDHTKNAALFRPREPGTAGVLLLGEVAAGFSRVCGKSLGADGRHRNRLVGYAPGPDLRQTLWAIYNKQALPNQPTPLQDVPNFIPAIQEQPAAEPSSQEQANPNQPAAQIEEPGLQVPTFLPRSLSPQAIKELRDEHKNFLQKLGVIPPTIPGEKEAVLRVPTQAEDISMTALDKGESTIGAAPVQQSVLEAYDSFRKKMLPETGAMGDRTNGAFRLSFRARTRPANQKKIGLAGCCLPVW